jgi:hypothetical protein
MAKKKDAKPAFQLPGFYRKCPKCNAPSGQYCRSSLSGGGHVVGLIHKER